jgi:hypothetical protein
MFEHWARDFAHIGADSLVSMRHRSCAAPETTIPGFVSNRQLTCHAEEVFGSALSEGRVSFAVSSPDLAAQLSTWPDRAHRADVAWCAIMNRGLADSLALTRTSQVRF